MKQLGSFLLGIVLMIVGAVFFLQNVVINSFSLYHYKEINVGGILIVLMAISFIVMLVKTNIVSVGIFILLAIAFVVSLLLSLNIRVERMSALELVLILGTLCVGIALVIKGLLGIKKGSDSAS